LPTRSSASENDLGLNRSTHRSATVAACADAPCADRHTFAYRLSAASGHNRAELERRLGHANDRYLRLYTNPPEDIAAGWAEDL